MNRKRGNISAARVHGKQDRAIPTQYQRALRTERIGGPATATSPGPKLSALTETSRRRPLEGQNHISLDVISHYENGFRVAVIRIGIRVLSVCAPCGNEDCSEYAHPNCSNNLRHLLAP